MQDDLKQVLTEQLRDIYLPEAVSWWPPAIGWWVLTLIILVLIFSLVSHIIRKKRRNAYRVSAALETQEALSLWLKNANTAEYLQTINTVLKRTMLHNDTTKTIANQSGINWVESLNLTSKQLLSEVTMQALGVDCYKTNPIVDIEHIHQQITFWIESHTGGEHA